MAGHAEMSGVFMVQLDRGLGGSGTAFGTAQLQLQLPHPRQQVDMSLWGDADRTVTWRGI